VSGCVPRPGWRATCAHTLAPGRPLTPALGRPGTVVVVTEVTPLPPRAPSVRPLNRDRYCAPCDSVLEYSWWPHLL
jgi:hypothetical protein